MADQVHELSEQFNPVAGDLLEVSHESTPGSGVWSSLKMKLSTLQAYLGTSKMTIIDFDPVINGDPETIQYVSDAHELVQTIVFHAKNPASSTIKMGVNPSFNDVFEENGETVNVINKYCNLATTFNITCTFDLSDVTIISILTK